MIDRWGGFVGRRALAVLLAGLAVVLASGAFGASVFDHLSQGGFDDPDSESAVELDREREVFGNQTVDVVAVYSAPDGAAGAVDDPAFEDAVRDVVAGIPGDAVSQVTAFYDLPPEAGLVSADGSHAQVLISLAGDSQDEYLERYEEIRDGLVADGLTTDVAGAYAVYTDVNETTSEDLERAELISLPVVILLALVIFGSAVAALMPAMVGVIALLGALAVIRVISSFTEVSVFAVNVISLLGIGLAIDYALFVVSRFREELAGLPLDDPDASRTAIARTMSTAGRTVLFSGLTVAAAMSSLMIFPQGFLRSMGFGGVAAVLVAMVASLTILPAVLRLLGRRVDAGRMPWRRSAAESDGGRWAALARGVMRRPVAVLVVTIAALMVIASPFLGARFGSVDYRVLPEEAASHQAALVLNEEFGPETSQASLLLDGTTAGDVTAYSERVAALGATVAPVVERDGVTLLRATWEGNSQTEASQDLLRDIRAVEPASGEVLVGGMTAETVDLVASIADHLPWMALIVVVVMVVLLFWAFGSVTLPVKAIVMNMISISASFGVVTWIFSDGNASDLLGFSPQGYLDATNPILMLAILFGLSMDYEVFLLSRVREQWDRSAGSGLSPSERNDLAVATGVQKTGRIITSAALLLGVVIGAFGTSGIIFMKMLGIGMLVALLIDATVVRALLVPATMKLLGGWNWYAPGPLRRWWEGHGFREEGAHETAPAREPAGV